MKIRLLTALESQFYYYAHSISCISNFFDRFDFDSQAVSPPAHDESFFYIRYPSGSTNTDKNIAAASSNTLKSTIADALIKQKADTETNKNMVQHTEPCKKFLNNRDRGIYLHLSLLKLCSKCK